MGPPLSYCRSRRFRVNSSAMKSSSTRTILLILFVFSASVAPAQPTLSFHPEVHDLSAFLLNEGNGHPHHQTHEGGENPEYFSSNESATSRNTSPFHFSIYYKRTQGYNRYKILHIAGDGLSEHIILASEEGDGQEDRVTYSQFADDSTWIEMEVNTTVIVDSEFYYAVRCDSTVRTYHFDERFKMTLAHEETTVYQDGHTIYHPEFEGKEFVVNSSRFGMNGKSYYWRYHVRYHEGTTDSSEIIWVDLLGQDLIDPEKHKTVMEPDLSRMFLNYNPINVNLLSDQYRFDEIHTSQDPDYQISFNSFMNEDVNADGYTDFSFITEISAAGANTSYDIYLYDPEEDIYDFAPHFSGYNAEYDPAFHRVSTFMKAGGGEYYYTFKNLNPNTGALEFEERVHTRAGTLYYKKWIGDVEVKTFTIEAPDKSIEFYLERR